MSARFLRGSAYLLPFAVFLAVYLPASGRGFVSDDFGWALSNRIRTWSDLIGLFGRDNGFYRPVVALTFSFNEYFAETNPKPYGLTNVGLALACAFSSYSLARALRMTRPAGIAASALWLLNFHGINMAVLWLSGRTALLLTLGATAMATALLKGRLVLACICLVAALFSKEEAVLLPVIGIGLLWILRGGWSSSRNEIIRWSICSLPITAGYLWLRAQTGAMTPFDAPSYYRFTFDLWSVGRNIIEYADRSLTLAALVTILGLVLLRPFPRELPGHTKCTLFACALWLVGAFAITVFLPVRSSLYVCLPSVAGGIAAAAILSQAWSTASDHGRSMVLWGAVVLPLAVAPIHLARAERYVGPAEFSTAVLADLKEFTSTLSEGSEIVIQDDRTNRVNLSSAFGTTLNDAFYFSTGCRMNLWVEPPVMYARLGGLTPPCEACVDAEFKVHRTADGRTLVRLK